MAVASGGWLRAAGHAGRRWRTLHKGAGGSLGKPAVALHLQRERKVPVVQRHHRVDAVRQQLVDQLRVEAHARLAHRAIAGRQDARPRDGEAVVAELELRHELHVRLPSVVVVRRHVACLARPDLAGRVREGVPDRHSTAALQPAALDLVGGSGGAEGKFGGKRNLFGRAGRRLLGCGRRLRQCRCRRRTEGRHYLRIQGRGRPSCQLTSN